MKFDEHVWEVCKEIPEGKVSTYKQVGKAVHSSAFRAVGNALRKNPFAPSVPCHRVVASNGSLGGFMGVREGPEIERKVFLLQNEGVEVIKTSKGYRIKDFDEVLFEF